jgi:hypothetical protein
MPPRTIVFIVSQNPGGAASIIHEPSVLRAAKRVMRREKTLLIVPTSMRDLFCADSV